MIRWLANWRRRRKDKQKKQQFIDALVFLRGEERRRKDYLAGYDEAAGFWAHLFCGSATQLERAIEESKKHRELHLVRHKWETAGDGENDEANT